MPYDLEKRDSNGRLLGPQRVQQELAKSQSTMLATVQAHTAAIECQRAVFSYALFAAWSELASADFHMRVAAAQGMLTPQLARELEDMSLDYVAYLNAVCGSSGRRILECAQRASTYR